MESLPGYDDWKTRSPRDDAEMHGNYDPADEPDEPLCQCGHTRLAHDYEEDGSCRLPSCACRGYDDDVRVPLSSKSRTPGFQPGNAGAVPARGTMCRQCGQVFTGTQLEVSRQLAMHDCRRGECPF